MMKKMMQLTTIIVILALALCFVANAEDEQLKSLFAKYQALWEETKTPKEPLRITPFLPSTRVNVMPDQPAWSGKEITVWGNCNDAPGIYKWDFGDGSPVAQGTFDDGRYIMKRHTYNLPGGIPFQVYTATLTVTTFEGTASDSVNILVVDKNALPTDIDGDGENETEIEVAVNIAVEDGLEYLYQNQNSDGSWYGSNCIVGPTGFAVLAFENHGYLAKHPYDDDIYAEYIQYGLNYLFTHTIFQELNEQPVGNPDPDGDGGLYFVTAGRETYTPLYETGMILMAIASTGTPDAVVNVSPNDPAYADLNGKTYFEIAEDIVHYLAWAQNDGGGGRGGWRYTPNRGDSDNSVSQWSVMGLQTAERLFGATIPPFVRPELEIWVNYIQHPVDGDPNGEGASGYDWYDSSPNCAKTGALIAQMEFLGDAPTTPRVLNALKFLDKHWNDAYYDYATYAIFKGLELMLGPNGTLPSGLNWRLDFDQYLVNRQDSNTGHWAPNWVFDNNLATAAAVLSLSRSAIGIPFVTITNLDSSGFPNIALDVRVNTTAGLGGSLTQGDFGIAEGDMPAAIDNFSFDAGVYHIEYTSPNQTADGSNRWVIVRVTDPDEGIGIDTKYYVAPLSGTVVGVNNYEDVPGAHLQIPVWINDDDHDVTELNITSVQFKFRYNKYLLTATGATIEGTLAAGWSLEANIGDGEVKITMSGANPLAGSGKLVIIEFDVPSDVPLNRITALEVRDLLINDGIPATVLNGQFHTILGCPLCFPEKSIIISQIQYTGGDYDPDPGSLENVVNQMNARTFYKAEYGGFVQLGVSDLSSVTMLYISGHGSFSFSEEERTALRNYLENGGFLFADDCNWDPNGAFAVSFEYELKQVLGDKFALFRLPNAHPVYHIYYDFPSGPPPAWGQHIDYFRGNNLNNRMAVLYSNKDIGCGWEELNESCIQMGINIVAYATTNIISQRTGDVSGNGTVSAYDAALILQYVVGLIDTFPADLMVSPSTITPCSYVVRVPEQSAKVGERIQIPIAVNDANGLSAGAITLKYDPTILRAIDYAPLKLLNGYYWKANTKLQGEVRFAFATTEPTKCLPSSEAKGQGNLLMVEFEVLPNTEGETSDLILDNVSLSNSLTIQKINGSLTVIPSNFSLLQNYPNPFNPDTWLPFKLANDAPVAINIYNAKGQLIRTIALGNKNAGVYITKDRAAYWDGRDSFGEKVASGVYFYTLQAGGFRATRKMLILK